jgi:hypothetical protein
LCLAEAVLGVQQRGLQSFNERCAFQAPHSVVLPLTRHEV